MAHTCLNRFKPIKQNCSSFNKISFPPWEEDQQNLKKWLNWNTQPKNSVQICLPLKHLLATSVPPQGMAPRPAPSTTHSQGSISTFNCSTSSIPQVRANSDTQRLKRVKVIKSKTMPWPQRCLSLSRSPHHHLVRYSTLFNAIYVLSFRMHSGNKQILP